MREIMMAICFDGLDMKIEELQVELALAETDAESMDINLKLAKLIAVRNERDKNKIKPETILKVVVDTVGLAGVLYYEQLNVITSKMWGIVSGKFFK